MGFNYLIKEEIHKFLTEAYDISLAKDLMSIERNPEIVKRQKEIMNALLNSKDGAFKSKRGDRVYIPFEFKSGQVSLEHGYLSSTHKEIEDALKNTEYKIDDYKRGYLIDKYGRNVKIGQTLKRLGRGDLINKFAEDSARKGSRSADDAYIVFSTHPYDIGGMSTGRGWKSCMMIYDIDNADYVTKDITHGTIVSYLIKKDDLNINKPISRILIKPFVSLNDGSDVIYSTKASRIYGDKLQQFKIDVENIISKIQNIPMFTKFKLTDNLYCDDFSHFETNVGYLIANNKIEKEDVLKYFKHPDKLTNDEIFEIIYFKPEYIIYLTDRLDKLQPTHIVNILDAHPNLYLKFSKIIKQKFSPWCYADLLGRNAKFIEDIDKDVFDYKINKMNADAAKWVINSIIHKQPTLLNYFLGKHISVDQIEKETIIKIITHKPESFKLFYEKSGNALDSIGLFDIRNIFIENPKTFIYVLNNYLEWFKKSYDNFPMIIRRVLIAHPNIIPKIKNHLDLLEDYDLKELINNQPDAIEYLHREAPNIFNKISAYNIIDILENNAKNIKYFIKVIENMNSYDLNYILDSRNKVADIIFKANPNIVKNIDKGQMVYLLDNNPNLFKYFFEVINTWHNSAIQRLIYNTDNPDILKFVKHFDRKRFDGEHFYVQYFKNRTSEEQLGYFMDDENSIRYLNQIMYDDFIEIIHTNKKFLPSLIDEIRNRDVKGSNKYDILIIKLLYYDTNLIKHFKEFTNELKSRNSKLIDELIHEEPKLKNYFYGDDSLIKEETNKEFLYKKTTSLQNDLENRYGVDLFIYYSGIQNVLIISSIIIPKEKRNQGIGTKVMEEICDYADEHNLNILLTPTSDFGGNKRRLINFYKYFGFVRNKDYKYRELMIREPQ